MSDREEPIRVLHVEDEPNARIIVSAILMDHGCEVIPAKSLSAGIKATRGRHIDVALLDLNLGDSFGLDTLRIFSKAYPRTPVVVLTGAHPNVGRQAIDEGAHDFLVKTEMTPETLVDKIIFTYHRHHREEEITRHVQHDTRKQILREARHGIATPLTPIALQLDNIRRKLTEHPDTLAYLASIERNVGRIRDELDHFDELERETWNEIDQGTYAARHPGQASL